MNNLIQIDLDGVIHSCHEGYGTGELYGHLVDGADSTINNLLKNGYQVEILTARVYEEWPMVKKWLAGFGLDHLEVTNVKKPARAYIDDRAIRFTSWNDVARYFL